MKDYNKIIENWINTYTVPFNTIPEKSQINTFRKSAIKKIEMDNPNVDLNTKNKLINDNLDEFFGCRFIKYNDERRIIIKNKNFKYDFYICAWNGPQYDDSMPTIKNLVYELINPIYVKEHYGLDDEYWVVIEEVKDLIKFLNIDYNYNEPEEFDYRVENGKFKYEGDSWDDGAEYYFKDSNLFKTIKEAISKKFEYEYAPYSKYNPEFNYLEINKQIDNFDDLFTKLNKEQIINTLTLKCWENHSIIEEYANEKEFVKLIESINDINSIKQLIKSLKLPEFMFIGTCNKLYNI